MNDGTVHFEKAVASAAANIKPFGDMDGGYFGQARETAMVDRLQNINTALRKERDALIAENKRLTMAIEAISGTIAIYRANQP